MVSIASLEKIEIIRSQEFMPSKARLKFLKKMIILGPGAPPGSVPVFAIRINTLTINLYNFRIPQSI